MRLAGAPSLLQRPPILPIFSFMPWANLRHLETRQTAHQSVAVWGDGHEVEFRVTGAIHAWWGRDRFLTGLAWDSIAAGILSHPSGPRNRPPQLLLVCPPPVGGLSHLPDLAAKLFDGPGRRREPILRIESVPGVPVGGRLSSNLR